MQSEEKKKSKVVITDRSGISLDGVRNVVSYDDTEAVLDTSCGRAVISGKGLNVSKFDVASGEITIDGTVDELVYVEQKSDKPKGRLLSGLFG